MYNVLLSWLKYSLTCFSLSSMPSQSQVIFFCSSSSLCLSCTCSISSSDVASVSSTSSSSVLSVASFRNSFGLGSFTNASKMGSTLNISWSPGSQKVNSTFLLGKKLHEQMFLLSCQNIKNVRAVDSQWSGLSYLNGG